ncbi:MAG: MauE/DoxX family redox-associated membrane protein [Microthrixaceae bacterium]
MTVFDAAYWAICLVLVTSGAMKVSGPDGFAAFIKPVVGSRPAPLLARLTGVAELVLGFVGLAFGGRFVAALVAVAYLAFSFVVFIALSRSLPTCGCFGSASAPPSGAHAAVNVISAVVAVLATARSTPGMADGLSGVGWWSAPTVAGVLLVTILVVVVDTKPAGATFAQRNTSGGNDERTRQRRV